MIGAAKRELRTFFKEHPWEGLGYLLLMVLIAGNDIIEIIPSLRFIEHDAAFLYVHESHDIVAVGIALFIAYKRGMGMGFLAVTVFYATHLPYFAVEWPNGIHEMIKITIATFMGYLGVIIIGRLREALHLAEVREKQALDAQYHRDESEGRYLGMLGAMSEVILIVDAWGACLEMPKTKPRDAVSSYFQGWVGRKLAEILDPMSASELNRQSRLCLDDGHAVGTHFASIDGRSICFDIVMSPIGEGRIMWVMREAISSQTGSYGATEKDSDKELSVD